MSKSKFIELKITGSLIERFEFEAKILPDRNFIQDMLNLEKGFWESIDAEEWEEVFDRLKWRSLLVQAEFETCFERTG